MKKTFFYRIASKVIGLQKAIYYPKQKREKRIQLYTAYSLITRVILIEKTGKSINAFLYASCCRIADYECNGADITTDSLSLSISYLLNS